MWLILGHKYPMKKGLSKSIRVSILFGKLQTVVSDSHQSLKKL